MQASMPSSPVIMQIIPELGPGGAEQGCIDVAIELKKAGSTPIVVSNGGARVHELARHDIHHIDLPVHSKNPLIIRKNIKKLRELIARHNVDIVHVRSRAPAWSAFFACKKSDAKFMTTCHAPYNFKSKTKQIYNSVMARGERVIAISHYVAHYLTDNYVINPNNIRLIHRGAALEKFHPSNLSPGQLIKLSEQWRLPDGANIIMLPGRLTRWKGHHVLIEAMDMLNRKDIFCVMIGSDQGRTEYRKELEASIVEKNLGGQIRIIDHCNDMPAAYMCSTIVVSASTDPEGFGRIPIEAQAMGRMVIGTDHGGAQETIIPKVTGWLVKPGDPRALCKAIKEALSLNSAQRTQMANHAMHHVYQNFSKEKMLDETLNVYAELLHEKYSTAPNSQKQAA
ncbi:MAG: glycosyltransferase family 4 protein [Pseudomonadota bacterium]